ncbi:hypothetical protein HQ325_12665 [Rhodococcus sp. BP-349]|uniref:hypothetical protein n=1 Tax=unclassified Rhodococcus (in: high G+C Gram-positive bacteria) TaxID=192944 RepID=UPI001C9AEB23|nr:MULTISPECIES: hypothetical protein [unclassified Rhodococcus (in: high G+C Gram-positive bacteria)]MBY6539527.1 hypothetical protein [Rhodococcus sp. BP-363]MBY6544145.1 hypothetical protein [Rhodococcus sp. BP-369]MBY6563375.1 hypothetical protein [Rhodococcus sp. BP-370]MBY6577667.1 hypothetical protein [Rhodococcus sp. BP-364]MBY6586968.1 hypothetical protein [Rhodococcus sp. BP-358]
MPARTDVAAWSAGLALLLVLMAWDGYNGRSAFAVIAFAVIATYALFVHPMVRRRRRRNNTGEAAHERG